MVHAYVFLNARRSEIQTCAARPIQSHFLQECTALYANCSDAGVIHVSDSNYVLCRTTCQSRTAVFFTFGNLLRLQIDECVSRFNNWLAQLQGLFSVLSASKPAHKASRRLLSWIAFLGAGRVHMNINSTFWT
jgi:hypothetical protein